MEKIKYAEGGFLLVFLAYTCRYRSRLLSLYRLRPFAASRCGVVSLSMFLDEVPIIRCTGDSIAPPYLTYHLF